MAKFADITIIQDGETDCEELPEYFPKEGEKATVWQMKINISVR